MKKWIIILIIIVIISLLTGGGIGIWYLIISKNKNNEGSIGVENKVEPTTSDEFTEVPINNTDATLTEQVGNSAMNSLAFNLDSSHENIKSNYSDKHQDLKENIMDLSTHLSENFMNSHNNLNLINHIKKLSEPISNNLIQKGFMGKISKLYEKFGYSIVQNMADEFNLYVQNDCANSMRKTFDSLIDKKSFILNLLNESPTLINQLNNYYHIDNIEDHLTKIWNKLCADKTPECIKSNINIWNYFMADILNTEYMNNIFCNKNYKWDNNSFNDDNMIHKLKLIILYIMGHPDIVIYYEDKPNLDNFNLEILNKSYYFLMLKKDKEKKIVSKPNKEDCLSNEKHISNNLPEQDPDLESYKHLEIAQLDEYDDIWDNFLKNEEYDNKWISLFDFIFWVLVNKENEYQFKTDNIIKNPCKITPNDDLLKPKSEQKLYYFDKAAVNSGNNFNVNKSDYIDISNEEFIILCKNKLINENFNNFVLVYKDNTSKIILKAIFRPSLEGVYNKPETENAQQVYVLEDNLAEAKSKIKTQEILFDPEEPQRIYFDLPDSSKKSYYRAPFSTSGYSETWGINVITTDKTDIKEIAADVFSQHGGIGFMSNPLVSNKVYILTKFGGKNNKLSLSWPVYLFDLN